MTTKPSHGRIPLELQAVFLASNRGEEVHTPPPGNIAFRMFQSIFQRSNNKSQPVTAPAPQPAPTPKNIRGFFGMARNQMRRASTKDITQDQSSKGQQARRASVTHAASVTDRTCPIRDISFECSSPTRSGKTKATYKTKIMPDDVSVASSVTFTVLHEVKKKTKKTKKEKKTPQSYLDTMMKARGYTKKRCYALECGYHNKTTRTQRLSYHTYVVDLVKDGKVDELRKLFATGLSTNPANVHGEGLINLVCRLGQSDILRVMIDAGCDVQVSDDYGRTPLHDACCATQPSFDIVHQLLKVDPYLPFVMDVRGLLPLSYVQEKDYDKWMHFLQAHEHEIWPFRVSKQKPIPPRTLEFPNSRPIPEPHVMLPSVFVEMLASGRMSPEEVTAMHDFDESSDDSDDSDSDDSSSDSYTDDDDDDEDDEDDEDVALEDFDPDNCSFGRMSTGGYTFDFSESNHETVQDNPGTTLTYDHDINANIQTLFDNIKMVKSQETNKSLESKTRSNDIEQKVGILDIKGQKAANHNTDTEKSRSLDQLSGGIQAFSNTPRIVVESDTATVKTNDTSLIGSENHTRYKHNLRSISSPRVTTAFMKQHIKSSVAPHQPITPTFAKNDATVTTIPSPSSSPSTTPTEKEEHHKKTTGNTQPQEIDLRQHCYWDYRIIGNHNQAIPNMVVVPSSVIVEDEDELEELL